MDSLYQRVVVDLQRNGAGSAADIARRVGSKRQPVRRVLDRLLDDGAVWCEEVNVLRVAKCRGVVVRRQPVRLYMLAVARTVSVNDMLRMRWC